MITFPSGERLLMLEFSQNGIKTDLNKFIVKHENTRKFKNGAISLLNISFIFAI